MYLKTLKVVGFKSFADRTRLEFEPGVTVVVGPNGSGKSNLVDAIAWVLGTQSTRSLRTEKMEDVIFAGTATRPALGRAEVTLILDNGDRALPLDLDEVAITRRLYRDGTSDYEINGMAARLTDIVELLSDGGIGRQQHVIVSQGEVDELLNAKPADHRAIVEEAAGILKHRLRKDRAIRRLERTDADLARLHDIVGELKRRLRPLRRQAEAAERYEGLRSEVVSLRLWLAGEELRRIRGRLATIAAERTEALTTAESAGATIVELDELLVRLEAEAGEAGAALERDTAAAARLETTGERLRRIASVARERRRALEAALEGAGERRRDLVEEARALEEELGRSAAEERRTAHAAEEAERRLRELEDEERSLAEQEALPVEGALAVARGELRALETAEGRDRRERTDIERRLADLERAIEQTRSEIDALVAELETLDSGVVAAQDRYETARTARSAAQVAWEDAQADVRAAEVDLATAQAKVEALEAALGSVDRARRALEEAGVRPHALAEALDVPPALAAAVGAALGDRAAGLIVDDGAVAEAVRGLKAEGIGGIGLLRRPEGRPAIADDVPAGFARLVDLLGPSTDEELAGHLLGDVVLVESWSLALDLVARHPGCRFVTPEGDLVDATGIRVADPEGAGPVMLEAARSAVAEADRELARARSRLVTTTRTFGSARAVEREALEALEALEAKLGGVTEALARARRRLAGYEEEAGTLRERRAAIEAAARSRQEQLAVLRRRLEALEGEEAERQRAWEDLARRRMEVAARRDAARIARNEAAAAHGAVIERRRMLERRLRAVREELQRAERPIDPSAPRRLAALEDRAAEGLRIVRSHIETLRARQRTAREAAGEAGRRLEAARARRREAERTMSAARAHASDLAIEEAELRVREEAVLEGLRRDADADPETALAARPPEVEGRTLEMAEAEERLRSLEAQLRRMGPINPLAAEEYRELSERHATLEAQLAELEDARAELRKVIAALDEEIAGAFVTAFEEIAAYYEQHFALLFPGGRGRLRLTDPTQPLTSGIEIDAQPLGKRVSRLSLLSGGERSLAALAFLFAVFRARPSPFYVLDEVEAALDDANLRRFLRLVDEFRRDAQLIIVTHQQQTMEAADVLYGVTLEPGGSSKVVAKRLTVDLTDEAARASAGAPVDAEVAAEAGERA